LIMNCCSRGKKQTSANTRQNSWNEASASFYNKTVLFSPKLYLSFTLSLARSDWSFDLNLFLFHPKECARFYPGQVLSSNILTNDPFLLLNVATLENFNGVFQLYDNKIGQHRNHLIKEHITSVFVFFRHGRDE
jgi:hypothetical protein